MTNTPIGTTNPSAGTTIPSAASPTKDRLTDAINGRLSDAFKGRLADKPADDAANAVGPAK